MILTPKKTTVAYRCNACGAMVMAELDRFKLSSMPSLGCSCNESSMRISVGNDEKVRITAPCMFCPNPHQYTLASKSFFDKDIFVLDCPYTGVDIVVMGKKAEVIAETDRANRELNTYIAEARMLAKEYEGYERSIDEEPLEELLKAFVRRLCEEGRIECECPEGGCYKCAVEGESLKLYCIDCNAEYRKEVGELEELARWFSDGIIKLEL